MKKKIWKYLFWGLTIALLVGVMSFVSLERSSEAMNEPKVHIVAKDGVFFLTQDEVVNRLKLKHVFREGIAFEELDVDTIETILNDMNEVESSEVYCRLGGDWEIFVEIRKPIARVINQNGEQFYLDDKGRLMYLSHLYTADVVPVTSDYNFWKEIDLDTAGRVIHNDSLKTISALDQIYQLSTYVCNDAFLSAQVTQIHLNEKGDFVLIPRVGDQKIVLGKAKDLESKFNRLQVFYKKGINKVGWDQYDTINLKYANQVVCTRK